jgi:tetratricopeptide (TPR) repeat protein
MNGIRASILVIMIVAILAQCQAETVTVLRGRVEGDSAFLGNDYRVELENHTHIAARYDAAVHNDGSFEIRDVPSGTYNLRLTTLLGETINEQLLEVHQFDGQISIKLPSRRSERPGTGTVSLNELRHPVPPKAFRAFAEAQRYNQTGHDLDAIRELELALKIYPEYSDARCNLGVQYIRLGRHKEALEQFEKAAASGPPSSLVYANMAFSLCALGRMGDAEVAARRSLALDKTNTKAHYLLGSILAKTVRPGSLAKAPEAADHLRRGAADVPHAYLEIAQMYMAEGDRPGAVAEVQLYLTSGDSGYRRDAERWLARILGN